MVLTIVRTLKTGYLQKLVGAEKVAECNLTE